MAGDLPNDLREFADTASEMASDRIELLLLEWREEKARLFNSLWLACVAGLSVFMIAVLVTGLAIYLSAPIARPWTAAGFILLYGATALWAARKVRQTFSADHPPFYASLQELRKDREWLTS
jgi:uncharacterized membrane protein YqjE